MILIENAEVFDGVDTHPNCSVSFEDGVVIEVDPNGKTRSECKGRIDLLGNRLVSGFIDIQVNGGGGVLFNGDPTVEGIRRIADSHRKFGTTSLLPTLITTDRQTMFQAISAAKSAHGTVPGIIGIHLEGPFLSSQKKGAHDASNFISLDDEMVECLKAASSELLIMVTLAPECVELEKISKLRESGIVVFAGHSSASFEQCRRAEDAGVSGYTHLFNAMTQFGSREPGMVGAALSSRRASFGIIADGHHVHKESFRIAVRCGGGRRPILVTDAMPTIGSECDHFELNGEVIRLVDGVLRNDAGSLAGAHITMDEAIRNAIEFSKIEWQDAVQMATLNPACAIGRQHSVGKIASGMRADFVELSTNMEVVRVWQDGVVVHENEGHSR